MWKLQLTVDPLNSNRRSSPQDQHMRRSPFHMKVKVYCWSSQQQLLILPPPQDQHMRWSPFHTKVKIACWSSLHWSLIPPTGSTVLITFSHRSRELNLTHSFQVILWGYQFIMDRSDQLTDLEAQIAREQASLLQLHIMKETLQSEVVAKQEELERVQGLKKKTTTRETHTIKEETENRTDHKYPLCKYIKQHFPLHLILNFHLHWNVISFHFILALQCQLIRHKDKHCNLWASTYPIMCSPMANLMLLSAELWTHQLLLCAWITQKDLQETLCFRKFCDFPCTLCPQPWDFCAPRHSVRSTGWPLVFQNNRKNNVGCIFGAQRYVLLWQFPQFIWCRVGCEWTGTSQSKVCQEVVTNLTCT